ncbi:hypothetical protein GH714_012997 [Hevea brasiliensis]|uniref:Arginyl-tRNA--protein transferase n=1 Tax=Hevea brasiliensis TaxID=3981 RepID=A0A6A6N2H6_HEVBR|nr:hypothetical protein GH714_012997 [Hevea brasiliensis]
MAGKMRRSEAGTSSSSNSGGETVVDCGRRRSSCGYCKSVGRTSLWARSITVDDYQDLLDRGWRRSGCFLYKPEMEKTCCPSYTIRLRASNFVPSKEQLRVLRRMQRFLDGSLDVNKKVEVVDDPKVSKGTCSCACHEVSSSGTKESLSSKNEEKNRAEHIAKYLSDQVDNAVRSCAERGFSLQYTITKSFCQAVATIRRVLAAENDPRHNAENNNLSPKVIAEKLAAALNQLSETSGLSVKACNGHINFYTTATQASSTEGAQIVTGSKSLLQGVKEKRYQMTVHNDTPDHVTEISYRRFLVDTPLVPVPPSGDGRVPPCGFGSFHQQYVVDGKLIAVGVIDILPKCLSSKYLFWDPDFAFLSLGKYSALQEIGWVRRIRWVPCNIASPLLDRKPYIVLSDHALLQNGESLLPHASENVIEMQHDDNCDEDTNDILIDDSEEMIEAESESSDDESGPETSGQTLENNDVGDILIGLKGSRVRYKVTFTYNSDSSHCVTTFFKDVQRAFGPRQRSYLESQLLRYKRVVGAEMSERIVYSLG